MSKKKVTDVVRSILDSFLEQNGYELFDVEYQKEGKDWFLRVYIDKEGEGSISIDDCQKVSVYLSSKLDEIDPVEQNYLLEVSSPGIDRPLIKDSDFIKYNGEMVDVFLYKSFNSQKVLSGRLESLEDEHIVIKDGKNQDIKIPREIVSKVKLAVIF